MQLDDGRVVSNFILQALRGEDITIYGDGLQTRSFCYVDDLIEAMIGLMATPDALTGPMNLGNPREHSILGLANLVIALTNSRSRIVRLPLPEDDPRQRQPDIGHARATLGWEPVTSIETGLRHTIDYFEARLRAGEPQD
jgi:UDP-glucuronate decarboxylase